MNRASLPALPGLSRLLRLASGAFAAGLPLLSVGCPSRAMTLFQQVPRSSNSVEVVAAAPPAAEPVRQVRASGDELPPATTPTIKQVPINLDTVLRLAEGQNRQIALARERVSEACAEKNIAAAAWVPDIYVGTSYYRHDGGIQLENGQLIRSNFNALFNGLELNGRFSIREATFQRVSAERKVWQQRGELTKITNETLLDAANTYIDLLLTRSSAAVAREMERSQSDLLDLAQKIARVEPAAQVQVEGLLAEVRGHRQAIVKVEQQGDAAAVKLAYLLGLEGCVQLVPVDPKLMPFDLVDANQPTCDLVTMALEQGPGVLELSRLLALIQDAMAKARSPIMMLPTVEMRLADGGFGAGPGSSLGWDNRWDMNLQARWNLNGLVAGRDRQRVAQSKLEQVQLTYQDLRAKLTAGVQESREAIISGRSQMGLGHEQIRHASKAYELSKSRLENSVPGSSITEVLQTIRLLELAKLTQLGAIGSYDKAQLRLLLLLGPAYCQQSAAPNGTPPVAEYRLPPITEERKD